MWTQVNTRREMTQRQAALSQGEGPDRILACGPRQEIACPAAISVQRMGPSLATAVRGGRGSHTHVLSGRLHIL